MEFYRSAKSAHFAYIGLLASCLAITLSAREGWQYAICGACWLTMIFHPEVSVKTDKMATRHARKWRLIMYMAQKASTRDES